MIDISIIVPIFNSEMFLDKCLKSLKLQLKPNLEFILVDDGSTDDSYKIIEDYVKKDKRFLSIRKLNGGSVSARNEGIKKAQGEYIAFIDSDDYIDVDYFSEMFEISKKTSADILVMPYSIESQSNNKICISNVPAGCYSNHRKLDIVSGILAVDMAGKRTVNPALWGKLFKSDVVVQVFCKVNEKIREGEDLVLFAGCCSLAENICIIDNSNAMYHYVIHANQLTKKFDTNFESRVLLLYDNLCDFDKAFNFPDFETQFGKLVVFFSCKGFENIYYRHADIGTKEKKIRIKNICTIANHYSHITMSIKLPLTSYIKCLLIKYKMVSLIMFIYKCLEKRKQRF